MTSNVFFVYDLFLESHLCPAVEPLLRRTWEFFEIFRTVKIVKPMSVFSDVLVKSFNSESSIVS